jgi:quercetin dioxygenase-like cupin family protein
MIEHRKCPGEDAPDAGRRDALVLLAALGVPLGTAQAQDPAKMEPRSYRVVLENEKVRVLEYVSRPGLGVCGAGKHSHPDHVTVVLTPAKAKVTREDGTSFVNELKAGDTFWDPASTHMAENIGGSGTRMILVEIKDKNWKPATG